MREFLLILSLLVSFSTFGETYRDWVSIKETIDPHLGVPSCRVYTNRVSPRSEVQLSLSFPLNERKAPVAMIALGASVTGDKIDIELFSNEATVALPIEAEQGRESYWYVPTDIDLLIRKIQNSNLINIYISQNGQPQMYQVSMMGATKALQSALECLGVETLYEKSFFSELSEASTSSEVIGQITPSRLHDLFQMAYSFYVQKKQFSQELESLTRSNEKALAEQTFKKQEYLKNKSAFEATELSLKELKSEEQKRKSLLAEASERRQSLELKVESTQKSFDLKSAHFLPLKKDEERMSDSIKTVKANIVKARSGIEVAADLERKSQEKLAQYRVKIEQMESFLRTQEIELARYREKRDQVQNQLDAINVGEMVSAMVSADLTYQGHLKEIQRLKSELPQKESLLSASQQDQLAAQQGFEACRRKGAGNVSPSDLCLKEMDALRAAQSSYSSAQRGVREVNTQIFSLESESSKILGKYRSQILSERNEVQNQRDFLREKVNHLEGLIENVAQEVKSLKEVKAPHHEEIIRVAQEKIREQSSYLSTEEITLKYLENQRQTFVTEKNFAQLELEFDRASKDLKQAKADKDQFEYEIKISKGRLIEIKSEVTQLDQKLAHQKPLFNEAKSNYDQIQESLEEVLSRQIFLERKISEFNKQYAQTLGHYKYVLGEVLN